MEPFSRDSKAAKVCAVPSPGRSVFVGWSTEGASANAETPTHLPERAVGGGFLKALLRALSVGGA
jgi:hypothetical protein